MTKKKANIAVVICIDDPRNLKNIKNIHAMLELQEMKPRGLAVVYTAAKGWPKERPVPEGWKMYEKGTLCELRNTAMKALHSDIKWVTFWDHKAKVEPDFIETCQAAIDTAEENEAIIGNDFAVETGPGILWRLSDIRKVGGWPDVSEQHDGKTLIQSIMREGGIPMETDDIKFPQTGMKGSDAEGLHWETRAFDIVIALGTKRVSLGNAMAFLKAVMAKHETHIPNDTTFHVVRWGCAKSNHAMDKMLYRMGFNMPAPAHCEDDDSRSVLSYPIHIHEYEGNTESGEIARVIANETKGDLVFTFRDSVFPDKSIFVAMMARWSGEQCCEDYMGAMAMYITPGQKFTPEGCLEAMNTEAMGEWRPNVSMLDIIRSGVEVFPVTGIGNRMALFDGPHIRKACSKYDTYVLFAPQVAKYAKSIDKKLAVFPNCPCMTNP